MRIGSTFKIALRALRRNKLRSALTALGIIIGVGAVIAMSGRMPNRKALFDIGISGPLAGLVPTMVCSIVGLQWSTIVPIANVLPAAGAQANEATASSGSVADAA